MKIGPTLKKIFEKYGGDAKRDLWDCHGNWIAYHKALERIARNAKIKFDQPYIIESDGEKWSVAICVTGHMDDQTEWSIGEASKANYTVRGKQTAYPYAMAEKRGKGRVILKLIGLHGLVYSEEEADEFKQQKTKSAYQARKDGDWEDLQAGLNATQTPQELIAWGDLNKDKISALPENWRDHLREAYEAQMTTLKAGNHI
jgi:hypothetical protein